MDKDIIEVIKLYGSDILESENINVLKKCIQHGNVSVFEHSLKVAYLSLKISRMLKLNIDERSLVRGALLHDYFLYDWHVSDKNNRLHAWKHANRAYENANKEFKLNSKEKDIILKHMFPINIKPPKYKESVLVTISDKISATKETILLSNHEIEELCSL